MSLHLRYVALLVIGVGASIALSPLASADPPSIPEPGSESAAATIGDLDNAGYDVSINYENGAPNVPLSKSAKLLG